MKNSTQEPSLPKSPTEQPNHTQRLGAPPATATAERTQAFRSTMRQARTHLNPFQRVFSHFIHVKPIAVTSDIIGGTLARPTALLCGALTAVAATLVLYGTAKYFGYHLSGSESLVAFGIGWVIGIIIEYTQVLLRGGRLKNKQS